MPGRLKFSLFRPLVEPSSPKKTNGDGLPARSSPEVGAVRERTVNIKRAWFFGAVALLFVLVNYVSRVKNRTDPNLGLDSASLVGLTLSPPVRDGPGFSVRFQLINRGNHSIFYPVTRTGSVPIGELVVRTSPSSEWMSSSGTSKEQRVLAAQQSSDSTLAWIEMPPGGLADGEFQDTDKSTEEHAYVIYVKTARDANGIRIVSKSYSLPGD